MGEVTHGVGLFFFDESIKKYAPPQRIEARATWSKADSRVFVYAAKCFEGADEPPHELIAAYEQKDRRRLVAEIEKIVSSDIDMPLWKRRKCKAWLRAQ